MKDGSVFKGTIVDTVIRFSTRYGEVDVRTNDIVVFKDDMLTLRDKTILKGTFQKRDFQFSMSEGHINLPLTEVAQIQRLSVPPTATSSIPDTSDSGQDIQESIPTAYGFYAVVDDRPEKLPSSPVVTTFGLVVGGNSDRGMAVDGMEGNPPVKLRTTSLNFILYQQGINVTSIRLGKLELMRELKAGQFNILGTKQQFFKNVYGRSPYDTIKINLWRPKTLMRLKVEPISSRPDMFRLTPETPLSPGRYAFYFGKSLREYDVVFTASPGRQAWAYYFEVGQTSTKQFEKTTSSANSDKSNLILGRWKYEDGGVMEYFRDGTFMLNTYAGEKKAGKWNINGDTLTLRFYIHAKAYTFKILELSSYTYKIAGINKTYNARRIESTKQSSVYTTENNEKQDNSNKVSSSVFATNNSNIYHKSNCPELGTEGLIEFSSPKKARKSGGIPCGNCNP
ncbi:MAG: hypothetical protein ACE5KZ_08100 [Candidatus Scalinduaceae bacterium]